MDIVNFVSKVVFYGVAASSFLFRYDYSDKNRGMI